MFVKAFDFPMMLAFAGCRRSFVNAEGAGGQCLADAGAFDVGGCVDGRMTVAGQKPR